MIIQNIKTGKRYEVLKGTLYPKTLYFEVKKDAEVKPEKPVKVEQPKKKRTYKRKTTKKGENKDGQ